MIKRAEAKRVDRYIIYGGAASAAELFSMELGKIYLERIKELIKEMDESEPFLASLLQTT